MQLFQYRATPHALLANNVRTPSAMLIATTCAELRPLALSADAASGVASIDFRSDCISSSLVCATMSSTFERTAGVSSLTSTTCILCMIVLDGAGGVCASDCAGVPCACTKAGVPRERAAIMTDAVKMRMVFPFQFEKQTKKVPIHEIWLASDSYVAVQ